MIRRDVCEKMEHLCVIHAEVNLGVSAIVIGDLPPADISLLTFLQPRNHCDKTDNAVTLNERWQERVSHSMVSRKASLLLSLDLCLY